MTIRDRPTIDLVILAITAVIGFVLITMTVAVVVLELVDSGNDTSGLVEAESEILAVLVGALVGFISGRVYGRTEPKPDVAGD